MMLLRRMDCFRTRIKVSRRAVDGAAEAWAGAQNQVRYRRVDALYEVPRPTARLARVGALL